LSFNDSKDTLTQLQWKDYFTDKYLSLSQQHCKNNQELNTLQEVKISRNEVRAVKGEYLPF
jgi:hypothetical protein